MPVYRKLFVALAALALLASACGGSSDGAATDSGATDSGPEDSGTENNGSEDDGSATPPSDAGSQADDGSTDDGATDPVEAESTDVFDIGLGDCFNDEALAGAGDDSAEITDVGAIPCDQAHQFEVYHVFDMLNDSFPGEDETVNISESGCFDAFEPFVGLAYEDSIYGLSYLYPTSESWKQGDREVLCVISMYDGTTKTGSARGTAQ